MTEGRAQATILAMGSVFAPPPVEEEGRRWLPLAIGAGIILVVVGAILIFGRPPKQAPAAAADPYAESLVIRDLKLSAAENFVGASVNYLDGKVTNAGGKTVSGATVEALFRNSMGQVVQRETQPLMLYHTGLAGFPDVAPLSAAPLTPNQTRDFRLSFEHISADWDHGYPELRFGHITTQ
ncbi:MAG: hypothetical protein ACR2IF_08445 [Terriglobales bacterium]